MWAIVSISLARLGVFWLALNQDDNSIVNIEERRAYNQNVARELQIDDSLNYNITFSHQGLIIKHQLIEENSTNPYDFDVDEKKGIIVIKSNKNAFNCLYASLESYCLQLSYRLDLKLIHYNL